MNILVQKECVRTRVLKACGLIVPHAFINLKTINMRIYLKIFLFSILIASCQATSENKDTEYIMSLEKKKRGSLRFDEVKYILLENTRESMFSDINKLILRQNRFYLLDKRGRRKILCFDISGNFIKSFGNIGKGKGEYIRIKDFDVDSKGNVYIYSSSSKTMIRYDSNGNFVNSHKIDNILNGFKVIEDKGFLFALDNSKSANHSMYRMLLKNGESVDFGKFSIDDRVNRLVHDYFLETESGFLSYVPTRDLFFEIDMSEINFKSMHIDFAGHTSSEDYKYDAFEKNGDFKKVKNYANLNKTPLFVNDMLIGQMVIGNGKESQRYDFACDTTTSRTIIEQITDKTYSHRGLHPHLALFNDSTVISFFDRGLIESDVDKELLPDSVVEHIENNGFVLTLKSGLCVQE